MSESAKCPFSGKTDDISSPRRENADVNKETERFLRLAARRKDLLLRRFEISEIIFRKDIYGAFQKNTPEKK